MAQTQIRIMIVDDHKIVLDSWKYLLESNPRFSVVAQCSDCQAALIEAEKLDLRDNHFYFALLAELYAELDNNKAAESLKNALQLAKTDADRQAIQKRLDRLLTRLQRFPDTI